MNENVSTLIATAFHHSRIRQTEINKAWIAISHRIGSSLPASLLLGAIQKAGELDLLLRCIEDDYHQNSNDELFQAHYQIMISELWIGSVYEIFRLLDERKLAPTNEDFQAIAHDLRLIRITLEKHEIAADRKLKEPLVMKQQPSKEDETDKYVYKKDDPLRAHLMPVGFSNRGSTMWQAIDIQQDSERWIERRKLSERIIALWHNKEKNS